MALLMVAADEFDDVQFTKFVRFWVSPLAKVPVARKGAKKPAGRDLVGGVTWMDERLADSTSTLAVPLIAPSCAVMVTVPADWPLTRPFGLTVATALLDELQVDRALIS